METIEIGEECYGPFIIIDGESVQLSEYDERGEDYIKQLKLKIIMELQKNIDKIPIYELLTISEIVVTHSDGWEHQEEESKRDTCHQCGTHIYNDIYRKIK